VLIDLKDPNRTRMRQATCPLQEARVEEDIFYFAVTGGEFYHKGTHGRLEESGELLEWQLQWSPATKSFHYGPKRLWQGLAGPIHLVAPNPDILVSGTLQWGKRSYQFKQVPGHQRHQWGPEYPSAWTWGQVRQFEGSNHSLFEGASFAVPSRWCPQRSFFRVLVSGKEYRLTRPWQLRHNISQAHVDRWHFETQGQGIKCVGHMLVDPAHLIGSRLVNSIASDRYCYQTQRAQLRLQLYHKHKGQWNLAQELKSLPVMAYEFGSSEPVPGIVLRSE